MSLRNPGFPRSNVLILGPDSIYSLLPSTLTSQAEALLDAHRIEDAVKIADQLRRRLQSKPTIDRDEADELNYICQRIGFRCLRETRFDEAGRHLFDGDLDPRLLISYYPEFCGTLFNPEDEVDVYAGVAEYMPIEGSIDEIIAANLVLNYSPHLSPNTRTALPAVELREILKLTATDMLRQFLRKWKQKRKVMMGAQKNVKVSSVVETVLAKMYSKEHEKSELYALIDEPNDLVLEDLELVLVESSHFNALFKLYRQRGSDSKLIDGLSRIVSGEWTDEEVEDPLSQMFTLLSEKRDRALIQQWGVWLTNRDPERALKLLTSITSNRRGAKAEEDQAVLKQLQETNPGAAAQFLEHLVLAKRSTNADLHTQLGQLYVERLSSCLSEEPTSKLWRAKAASYTSSLSDSPYFYYFASTTPESPSKHVRLKAMLFLQGSIFYDPQAVRERLQEHEKALSLEMAIVEGKCGNDRAALTILAHTIRDFVSAEAYCTLGGEIIPAKVAQSFGERFNLQPWAALFVAVAPPGSGGVKHQAVPMKRQKTVSEERKRDLARVLLEVYMEGGESMSHQTAQLINSQSMNLDIVEIISLLPPSWPVNLLDDFLSRSFRRMTHAKHEGQLVKAISSAQNLEVAEKTYLVLRDLGADIEEAVEEDGNEDGGDGDGVEKIVSEKPMGLGLDVSAQPPVEEIRAGEKGELVGYDVGQEGAGRLDSSIR